MGFLLTKKGFAVHRTPDSKIRKPKGLSCCCAVGTKNPVGLVATVFPEFVARDGQEPTDVGCQGNKRQGGAARRRSRGHGLARLDGTRPRATVAAKVMKSGKMAGQATAVLCADCTQAPARRPEAAKPGRRRQGCERLAKASPVRDERGSEPGAARPDQGDAVG